MVLQSTSMSDLFSNQVDFNILNNIGKLLTKDKNTFIKYKVVGNSFFGLCLELKARLGPKLSAWFTLNQVIHMESVVDFQSLELVMRGISFTNMTRKLAITKCNSFLKKCKSFTFENQILIHPAFEEISSANGPTGKFPVNVDTILACESG